MTSEKNKGLIKSLGFNQKMANENKQHRKTFSGLIIQVSKDRYIESNNPLFALKAYKICREFNLSLPKWVQEYLDNSISNILEINLPEKNKISDSIANAMGMKSQGRGSIFSKFHKLENDIKIALRFDELVEESKFLNKIPSKDSLMHQVAVELNSSYSKVEKAIAWYQSYSS